MPKSIEISENINVEVGAVLADPSQIHQVVMNLCTNASHAMKEKGGILEVSLDAVTLDRESIALYPRLSPGRYMCLKIRDTGHGMSEETLERIFEPFFTTKAVGEGNRTWAFCCAWHHHEAPRRYSCRKAASMKARLLRSCSRWQTKENLKTDAPSTETPHGSETILFVDDEEIIVRMSEQMLANLGYTVHGRTSSVEALEAFRSDPRKFDLVITDQNMPQMNGTELTRELHHIRRDLPVILTTGFSETITADNYRTWGISALIMKPVVFADAAQTIRRVLDSVAAGNIA